MTERDERALRQALQDLGSDDPVDLGQVRRRAAERRRNGRTVAGLAVALVLRGRRGRTPPADRRGGGQPTSAAGGAGPSRSPGPRQDSGPASRAGGRADRVRQAPPSPTDAAPEGWRTEYYRDISFQVPASWGYAVPPQSDWCADEPQGRAEAPTSAARTSGWA